MPGGRPAKRLADHVLEGTFRPKDHQRLLAGEDLPQKPPHPSPSPAMGRLWDRMRDLQSEFRASTSAEVRRDLAVDFSRLGVEYMKAAKSPRQDPTKDIPGIGAILKVNRRAFAEAHARGDTGIEA